MPRRACSCCRLVAALTMVGCLSTVLPAMELRVHEQDSAARLVAAGNEALVQGDYEQAITAYQDALERSPRNFHALFNLALARQEQQQWEQARRRYQEALSQRPEHAMSICNLGMIAYAQGDYQEAVARFASAAQLASGQPREAAEYLYNLATAREALGQWSEARDAYRSAIELDPEHYSALYNLGTLHLGRELPNLSAAERYLKLAHRVAPERADALINLALLAERQQNYEEARNYLDQAVEISSQRQSAMLKTALWRRAQFFKERREHVAMRRDLQELLGRDEHFPGANAMLGEHYYALGDYEDAITHLQREVDGPHFDSNHPDHINAVYLLARIYSEHRPNPRRALEYATRFYRLRPDSPRERELRRRLRRDSIMSTDEETP